MREIEPQAPLLVVPVAAIFVQDSARSNSNGQNISTMSQLSQKHHRKQIVTFLTDLKYLPILRQIEPHAPLLVVPVAAIFVQDSARSYSNGQNISIAIVSELSQKHHRKQIVTFLTDLEYLLIFRQIEPQAPLLVVPVAAIFVQDLVRSYSNGHNLSNMSQSS